MIAKLAKLSLLFLISCQDLEPLCVCTEVLDVKRADNIYVNAVVKCKDGRIVTNYYRTDNEIQCGKKTYYIGDFIPDN